MVDRCICFNITFSEMQQVMLKRKIKTLAELKKHLTFGQRCTLCIPFVKLMIKTGRVEFKPDEVFCNE
ncbi:MAG: (2Fe-2S)-binding protein [Ignavibacteria bacterium]|nr:(2Fe-2S)-binding protein [Ignavibacteria bacterium]